MSDRPSNSRGGRGGGGGRGRSGPLPRPVQVSKKLSWLLRHGAEKENLALGPSGYANVAEVLANRNLRSLTVTFEEVRQIVRENYKQRFALVLASEVAESRDSKARKEKGANGDREEGGAEEESIKQNEASEDPNDWLIRATQGHSLKLADTAALLTPLVLSSPSNLPPMAVHGTTHSAWPLILASGGLIPMGRNHIHLAAGLPAGFAESEAGASTQPVISGMRNSSSILIYLDLAKALEAGIPFGISENGVILTEGNEEGLVPVEMFKRVEDRTGLGVLVEDGKVVKKAPASWSKGERT